ncbi:MAG: alpha/beta hydrolase, partial [Verrucomicrobia bacterium]|nr:alpha/beta hydrolase [Verrucomicrobiota bacterium]
MTTTDRSNINKLRAGFLFLAVGLLLAAPLPKAFTAEEHPAPERIALWPGQAPVGNGQFVSANAFITVYRPAKGNGAAIVICPGGGYGGLVTGPEGSGIAQWLNKHGIAGIVLEYRLPNRNQSVPLLDAQRAIRTVRAKAPSWAINPQRIGIIGFSAGGHLASTAATHFDSGDPKAPDPIDRFGCRPDFAVLIYPVITLGEQTHGGSKANLLGPTPTSETVALFSNERQVTAQTSPTFLVHAKDDQLVSPNNSRLFYEALQAHKVPAQYLELPSGGHGLNGYQGPMWDAWQAESLKWLVAQKIIPNPDSSGSGQAVSNLPFPDYEMLANGPQQVRLLAGQRQVVFSMYGAPAELEKMRQLVGVMHEQKL